MCDEKCRKMDKVFLSIIFQVGRFCACQDVEVEQTEAPPDPPQPADDKQQPEHSEGTGSQEVPAAGGEDEKPKEPVVHKGDQPGSVLNFVLAPTLVMVNKNKYNLLRIIKDQTSYWLFKETASVLKTKFATLPCFETIKHDVRC